MLMFSLVDLPRSTWTLPPRAPGQQSGRRGMRPTLLASRDEQTIERLTRIIALFDEAIGCPRADLEERLRTLEETMGNYRLARCLSRCIDSWYSTTTPELLVTLPPREIRRAVFQAAQEQYGGIVALADRAAFLAGVASSLDCTSGDLEDAMFGDAPDRLLLTRSGPPPTPHEVIARYNAAAVTTLLAASAPLTLRLPVQDSMAIKALYRAAKALYVGVDLAVATDEIAGDGDDNAPASSATQYIKATLYGPGSRALVRLRNPVVDANDDLADAIPAAGGVAVAAVVRSLVRYATNATNLSGWGRVLLPDQRQYIAPFDGRLLRTLIDNDAEDLRTGAASADTTQYDSAVEEKLGTGFHALTQRGMARGWQITREPRAVFVETPDVGTQVFLPDFSFRRGTIDVLCEVIGFYTEEYLARKARKMALLAGRVPLLLLAEEKLAPRFQNCGHPLLSYRDGRPIALPALLDTLDTQFDPPQRRRATARNALAALISHDGPTLNEDALLARIGVPDRGELLSLWTEVTAQGDAPPMRYLSGYGLLAQQKIEGVHDVLDTQLPLSLDRALALLVGAGVDESDESFLVALGYQVTRDGLFGEATVSMPIME